MMIIKEMCGKKAHSDIGLTAGFSFYPSTPKDLIVNSPLEQLHISL